MNERKEKKVEVPVAEAEQSGKDDEHAQNENAKDNGDEVTKEETKKEETKEEEAKENETQDEEKTEKATKKEERSTAPTVTSNNQNSHSYVNTPKSKPIDDATQQGGLVPNKFLQHFSKISKSLNTNPAVVRAGIVLQSAADNGVFPVLPNQEYSSDEASDDDFSSVEGSDESSDENQDKAQALDEKKTRQNVAEAAASAAEAVTSAAVATASAAASSSVSSGFRGRYTLFGSNTSQLKSFTSPSNANKKSTSAMQSPVTPTTSVSSTGKNNNETSGSGVKSPGTGLFNALSKRGNRIIANARASPSPGKTKGTLSQTALILNSSAGPHMKKILSELKEGEFVMFLGPGFMGVNLKQSFQKRHGVYVDYIVPNGSADKSGVVNVGDCLLKVGNTDVTHGTIRNVPNIIAQADRPVIIVLQRDFIVTGGPMDIAIGKVLKVQEEARGGVTGGKLLSHLPVMENAIENKIEMEEAKDKEGVHSENDEKNQNKLVDKTEQNDDENKSNSNISNSEVPYTPKTKDVIEEALSENNSVGTNSSDMKKSSGVKTHSHHRQNSNRMMLPSPNKEVKASLAAYANKRNNEMSSFAAISRAAKDDAEFQEIIVAAFHSCCIDSRCLTFVASYFSGEDSYDYYAESNGVISSHDQKSLSPKSSNAPPTSSIRLMLYLEILSYEELFGVTPSHRLRDHAKRIAHKFLVPTVLPAANTNKPNTPLSESYAPPMFDLRSALPPPLLHEVAKTIEDKSIPITRDVFKQCKIQIRDSLCGNRFANFLISNECARMRAYLRGTCHFRHIPIEDLWNGLKARETNASNYFLYAILHFVCWVDESDSSNIQTTKGKAVAGICAALFIQRELIGCIKRGKDEKEKLLASFEHFWEVFLAPHAGMLDSLAHSNECQESLEYTRALILKAVSQPYVVKALVEEEIVTALKRLAEELLYDYAVNMLPKFKESVAHELVCFELRNHQKEEYDGIPSFPEGCIARLVRRSHFPVSVSTHKPRRGSEDVEVENRRKQEDIDINEDIDENQLSVEDSASRSLFDQLDKEVEGEHIEEKNLDVKDTVNGATPSDRDYKSRDPQITELADPSLYNADFAIVFGSDDASTGIPAMGMDTQHNHLLIKRFATVPLGELKEANIPSTLESYAVVPAFRKKSSRFRTLSSRISDDGWEASLINYIVPNPSTDNPNRCIYGVSLVLHQKDIQDEFSSLEDRPINDSGFTGNIENLVSASPTRQDITKKAAINDIGAEEGMVIFDDQGSPLFNKSPISSPSPTALNRVGENVRRLIVSAVTPEFSRQLGENKWSQTSRRGGNTIGITLISSRNVIPAMRSTLSQFFESLTVSEENEIGSSSPTSMGIRNGRYFAPLADIFGTMSMPSVNKDDLQRMLEPYIDTGRKPWIDRPLAMQKDFFEDNAGMELIQCVPPIPLALLFIAALLEQKIIFSSTRRSVLLSACSGLTNLLHPIDWSHLLVPLVPTALAHDLIQYPAPYIIGISTDDPHSVELLNSLPPEVTLVDLDVGRVILASSLASESNKVNATSELRSQMLCLAETLGDLFGEKLNVETWLCDDPYPECGLSGKNTQNTPYKRLKGECSDFINELLTGTSSCCYWIEENHANFKNDASKKSSSTVLFDEDRFLHLKNLREQGHYMPLFTKKTMLTLANMDVLGFSHQLALSLDFDLILKSFLRTQGMSTYISSRPKNSMAFW